MQPTLSDDTEDLLTDWVDWQRMQNLSHRTIAERVITVRAFLALQRCTPRTMTVMDVARYCGRVELSASSRNTYHGVLRAFGTWMVKVGVRGEVPTAAAPRTEAPEGSTSPAAPGGRA